MPEPSDLTRLHRLERTLRLPFFCAALRRTRTRATVMTLVGLATLAGCVVYEQPPAPAPAPSTFERSWNAALAAVQDEGVRITSEDRANGVIKGFRDQQEVTINLQTQADGNVRIEMSARGRREPIQDWPEGYRVPMTGAWDDDKRLACLRFSCRRNSEAVPQLSSLVESSAGMPFRLCAIRP